LAALAREAARARLREFLIEVGAVR